MGCAENEGTRGMEKAFYSPFWVYLSSVIFIIFEVNFFYSYKDELNKRD